MNLNDHNRFFTGDKLTIIDKKLGRGCVLDIVRDDEVNLVLWKINKFLYKLFYKIPAIFNLLFKFSAKIYFVKPQGRFFSHGLGFIDIEVGVDDRKSRLKEFIEDKLDVSFDSIQLPYHRNPVGAPKLFNELLEGGGLIIKNTDNTIKHIRAKERLLEFDFANKRMVKTEINLPLLDYKENIIAAYHYHDEILNDYSYGVLPSFGDINSFILWREFFGRDICHLLLAKNKDGDIEGKIYKIKDGLSKKDLSDILDMISKIFAHGIFRLDPVSQYVIERYFTTEPVNFKDTDSPFFDSAASPI
ncbi:MAG: hypothetical protein AABY43_00895, partial [Candidatus Omnitrophota bacterium]